MLEKSKKEQQRTKDGGGEGEREREDMRASWKEVDTWGGGSNVAGEAD